MIELPLGFRVSGCFGTKHPIKDLHFANLFFYITCTRYITSNNNYVIIASILARVYVPVHVIYKHARGWAGLISNMERNFRTKSRGYYTILGVFSNCKWDLG